jgi:hypothetical protein
VGNPKCRYQPSSNSSAVCFAEGSPLAGMNVAYLGNQSVDDSHYGRISVRVGQVRYEVDAQGFHGSVWYWQGIQQPVRRVSSHLVSLAQVAGGHELSHRGVHRWPMEIASQSFQCLRLAQVFPCLALVADPHSLCLHFKCWSGRSHKEIHGTLEPLDTSLHVSFVEPLFPCWR